MKYFGISSTSNPANTMAYSVACNTQLNNLFDKMRFLIECAQRKRAIEPVGKLKQCKHYFIVHFSDASSLDITLDDEKPKVYSPYRTNCIQM